MVSMSSGYSLLLNSDPLMASHGNLYTCRASIDITDINVSLSGEKSIELIVTCKLHEITQLKMSFLCSTAA